MIFLALIVFMMLGPALFSADEPKLFTVHQRM